MTDTTPDSKANSSTSHQPDVSLNEQALAHLERLQLQLDNLRSAIPSIVAPLLDQSSNKAQVFANMRKAALQSSTDLQTFRDTWTSEQTQQLLSQSRASLQQDPDLSMASEVAKYGWSSKT